MTPAPTTDNQPRHEPFLQLWAGYATLCPGRAAECYALSQLDYFTRCCRDLEGYIAEEAVAISGPSCAECGWVETSARILSEFGRGAFTRKQVQRALQALERDGWIARKGNGQEVGKRGKFRLNLHRLLPEIWRRSKGEFTGDRWAALWLRVVMAAPQAVSQSELADAGVIELSPPRSSVLPSKEGGGPNVQVGGPNVQGVDEASTLKNYKEVPKDIRKDAEPPYPLKGEPSLALTPDEIPGLLAEQHTMAPAGNIDGPTAMAVVSSSRLAELFRQLHPGPPRWSPAEARMFIKAVRDNRLPARAILALVVLSGSPHNVKLVKDDLRATLDCAKDVVSSCFEFVAAAAANVADDMVCEASWTSGMDMARRLCAGVACAKDTVANGVPSGSRAGCLAMVWVELGFSDRLETLGPLRELMIKEAVAWPTFRKKIEAAGPSSRAIWGVTSEDIDLIVGPEQFFADRARAILGAIT